MNWAGGVAGMATPACLACPDVALSGLTCRPETVRDVIDGNLIVRPFACNTSQDVGTWMSV